MTTTAAAYRRWAEVEALGVSSTYYKWAMAVADTPAALDLINSLPRGKQQPNLVFAAARFEGAPVSSAEGFTGWLISHWEQVRPVILARSTQTNEAGRCAVLLPVLAALPGPLALIEAGASAGLCLYPDRYSYRYADPAGNTLAVDPPGGVSDVILPCSFSGSRAPSRLPEVVWRAGVDLNPIDPTHADSAAWLETLIWPEHEQRRARLRAALTVAARDPAHLVAGDLIERLPGLIEQVPPGAQVVVFHSSVLVYLEPSRREDFVRLLTAYPDLVWVSNEGEGVLPRVAAQVAEPVAGRTILAVNGDPVALVGPHGQSYRELRG